MAKNLQIWGCFSLIVHNFARILLYILHEFLIAKKIVGTVPPAPATYDT